MKSLFPSYYPLDEKELNELWENATFVFDTNTLLNLFRYKESSTQNILDLLSNPKVKDRIFIPHQVALELHRNYTNVMSSHRSDFDTLKNIINKNFDSLTSEIKDMKIEGRHPEIEPSRLIQTIESFKNEQLEIIKSSQNNYNFKERSLNLLGQISDIIKDRIGSEFTPEEFNKESTEAERRIKEKIPPGYKDSSKKEKFSFNGNLYHTSHGDYFFWKQTLIHCKEKNIQHLIIVSNDNKEDWWLMEQGRPSSPRRQLRDEMRENGVTHFHIYNQQHFLQEIDKLEIQKVEKETFEDIDAWDVSQVSIESFAPLYHKFRSELPDDIDKNSLKDHSIENNESNLIEISNDVIGDLYSNNKALLEAINKDIAETKSQINSRVISKIDLHKGLKEDGTDIKSNLEKLQKVRKELKTLREHLNTIKTYRKEIIDSFF